MAVKVKLSDGTEYVLKGSLDELAKAVRLALDNSEFIEVEDGEGVTRRINPSQIVTAEEAAAEDAALVVSL